MTNNNANHTATSSDSTNLFDSAPAARAPRPRRSNAFRAGAMGLGLVALMGLAACDIEVDVVEDEAGNSTITIDDTTEGTGPELIIEEGEDDLTISGDWVDENVTVDDGSINIDTSELEDDLSDDPFGEDD